MPESSGKNSGKGKNDKSASDKIVQYTQLQLENLIQTMVTKVTAPMKLEIKLLKNQVSTLKNEVAELEKSQKFICRKHDNLKDNYNKALSNNIKCNQGIEHLNRRMTDLQKKNNDKDFKPDELEQYDRRQNLEFAQVPYHEGENVTQIVLDLASKLEIKLDNEDISIAHRLPQKNIRQLIKMEVKNQRILLL